MDGFKPLVEVAGKPFIEHAIDLFRDSGVGDIVVVIGHRAETMIPVLEAASCHYVVNDNYQNGMLSSIQKGVMELEDACDAFFLLPVDIPCVRTATIRQLMQTFAADPSTLVCYPAFQSRRGHPPLIDSSLIDHVIAHTGEEGMRGVLREYEDRAVTVPVADPFIRLDVDTAEAFSRLTEKLSKFSS